MSSADTDEEICPICNKEINDDDPSNVSKLFRKGVEKIDDSSRKRGRDDVVVTEGQRVHKDRRKWYTNDKNINQTLKRGGDSSPCVRKKSARVTIGPYNCRTDCLFCGQAASGDSDNVSEVKTDAFPQTVLAHCEERSDDWSFIVQGRIEYFGKDLHAAECIYHQQCSVNFRSGRDIPEQFRTEPVTERRKSGRPKNEDQEQAFLRVCAYLEANDEEQLTITDLSHKMRDYLLVETSLPYGKASGFQSTTLIGEDTDLLILLLYHSKPGRKSLYYRSDKSKSKIRVYNINKLKCMLGNELCPLLLFVHAFTGCDTTSRIFGIGKKVLFQKLSKGDTNMKSCALAFTEPGQTNETIEENGLKAMILLFGGTVTSDTLTSLRHSILTKKVVSATSFVTPERLPPTASATKYHSLRVYYQIMTWMGKETSIDATDWGWKSEANQLIPVMTDKNAAPDNLLKVVHCNCTTGCSTQRCTCRRYGLPCTSACGQCQLDSCSNPHNHSEAEVDQDTDNDDNDQ